MFTLFKKKPADGQTLTFKIKDMHCASCALTIDETLEEQVGVLKATTSYARSSTQVVIDEQKISPEQIVSAIAKAGYTVEE